MGSDPPMLTHSFIPFPASPDSVLQRALHRGITFADLQVRKAVADRFVSAILFGYTGVLCGIIFLLAPAVVTGVIPHWLLTFLYFHF